MKKYLIYLIIFFSIFIGISSTKAYELDKDINYEFKVETNNGTLKFKMQDLFNLVSDYNFGSNVFIVKSDVSNSVDIIGISDVILSYDEDKIYYKYKSSYGKRAIFRYNFETSTYTKVVSERRNTGQFYIDKKIYACIVSHGDNVIRSMGM